MEPKNFDILTVAINRKLRKLNYNNPNLPHPFSNVKPYPYTLVKFPYHPVKFTYTLASVYNRYMLTEREIKRGIERKIERSGSKNQILTTGGIEDYYLDPQDFNKLVNLFSQASTYQLKPLLKSLLTNRELVDITRRIIVGKMLLEGSTYQEIQKRTKNAARTTSFVRQSLLINRGILKKLIEQTYNLTPIDQYIKRRLKKGK